MGVTSSLRKLDGCESKEINEFLYKNMPGKDEFVSNLGIKPFDRKNPILIGDCVSHSLCGQIGAISEWYIDILASRYTENETNFLTEVADKIFVNSNGEMAVRNPYRDSAKRIMACYKCVRAYVNGESVGDNEVIEALNTIDKHGLNPFNSQLCTREHSDEEIYYYIFENKLEDNVVSAIKQIGDRFLCRFIESGKLKKDSTVIIKPKWGAWSKVYGAEGDIFIDGIIYDIKSRSTEGYKGQEIAQIYAYYICHLIEKYYDIKITDILKHPSNLQGKDVTGIGLYLSRFGEIVTCDMSNERYCLSEKQVKPIADMIALQCQEIKNNRKRNLEQQLNVELGRITYEVVRRS